MQSMQRSIGRTFQKSPGDNAKTAVLLKDYDDAEQVLTRIAEQVGSWRAAWTNLAHAQLGFVTELESLYDPIVGAADENTKTSAPTPELLLERTLRLREAYAELKDDLLAEIEDAEIKIIKPVSEARDSIAPVRKTIKKREKLRLDYENIQTDVTKLQRKPGRTPKDEKALAKAEAELGPRADAFHEVDGRLKEVLPPMIELAFSMLHPVISSLVMIQNRLLGLYYTTLHTYCEDFHFPLPPPGMENVVEMWASDYDPIRLQVEAISCVVHGRGARMLSPRPNTDLVATSPNRRPTAPGWNPDDDNNGPRRASTGLIPSTATTKPARPARIPSTSALGPGPDITNRPSFSTGMATDFTTASRLGQGSNPQANLSPAAARMNSSDYFGRPSSSSLASSYGTSGALSPSTSSSSQGVSTAISSLAQVKKKPPPPPPPKPKPRAPDQFAIALYAYSSQGSGDLSFAEGDRIKITKKTATDQDWWEGELGGVKGSFPANYCRVE